MSKSKKYDYQLEQVENEWVARVTRKITSKKVVVSQQQDGFETEAAAKAWAEKALINFSKTQSQNNQRQGAARKVSEETRRLRSARRADKTATLKAAKAADCPDESQDQELS